MQETVAYLKKRFSETAAKRNLRYELIREYIYEKDFEIEFMIGLDAYRAFNWGDKLDCVRTKCNSVKRKCSDCEGDNCKCRNYSKLFTFNIN